MIEQQQIQRVAHACTGQRASIEAACNGKNIMGCYRASACKCACSLKQDPANALADSWRQCVRND